MRTYDKYKESGIEWIGEIPEHWEVKKLKYLLEINGRIGFRGYTVADIVDEGEGAITLSPSNIKDHQIILDNCQYISWKKYYESPEIQIFAGDIVYVKTGSTIGKVGYFENVLQPITLNPQLVAFKKIKGDSRFLYFSLVSKVVHVQNSLNVNGGATESLSQDKLGNYFIILPLHPEQTAIANYLDNKTTEIDQTIADKEALISLFEEEKKALINEAVTKGLNPKVKFKASGIDWLGDIPEHWEIKKLFYLFDKISSGTTPKSDDESYYLNGDINWLNTGDLNDSIIKETSKKITQKAFDDHSALKVYPIGSIVIAMYGATIGKLGILEIETTTNQACCVLSDIKNAETMFVFNCLVSGKEALINMSFGGGQPNISQDTIRNFKIPFPPLKEQSALIKYIKEEAFNINEKITLVKQEIELLKEYRQALIFEAVTGKICVL